MNLLVCFLSAVSLFSRGWIVPVGGSTPDRQMPGATPDRQRPAKDRGKDRHIQPLTGKGLGPLFCVY